MPPVDITAASQFGELDRRIAAGPITLVFVYAPWCGHCTRFKPTMDALEAEPERSVQIARVRDDVYPSTKLASNAKVSSYPSLLLVDKQGNATQFQTEGGEVTNSIPDYKNEALMRSIVKNMGTPEGQSILKNAPVSETALANNKAMWTASSRIRSPSPTPAGPTNIVADRMTTENVNRLNGMLERSNNALLKASAQPAQPVQLGGGRSLFATLSMAAKNLAPASALLLGAQMASKKSKGGKTRKTRRAKRA